MKHKQILKAGRHTLAVFATILGIGIVPPNNANAVPVAVGASAGLSGTTAAARPELAGTVLQDVIRPFTMTTASGAVIKGTFQDRVVKRNVSGTLDFIFRIKNDPSSGGNIVLVNRTDYSAFPVLDIDFRVDGLGTVGAKATSFLAGPAGDVRFDFFNDRIKPGAETRFHFIGTRATAFNLGGVATIRSDNGAATQFRVFSPVVKIDRPTRRLPNLVTKIFGPISAKRGEDISDKIKVIASNIGTAPAPGTTGVLNPANGYMIDVMLSSDMTVPTGYATYSPIYSEDVLLLGGRVSNTSDLAPGATDSYAAGATIPQTTHPGHYFLAVRIDPGDKVAESNEADNTYFLPIQIF
ncbi:hypothetical protein IAD21_02992 [Abditibacteriota bacterium]|nr:hypothetical protein IAD21_02992 [Abditibacteriota bacterium]